MGETGKVRISVTYNMPSGRAKRKPWEGPGLSFRRGCNHLNYNLHLLIID
jgi:hypothetical protein